MNKQRKFIFLDTDLEQIEKIYLFRYRFRTDVDKVSFWGHHLKLEKDNKLQYIAEY